MNGHLVNIENIDSVLAGLSNEVRMCCKQWGVSKSTWIVNLEYHMHLKDS